MVLKYSSILFLYRLVNFSFRHPTFYTRPFLKKHRNIEMYGGSVEQRHKPISFYSLVGNLKSLLKTPPLGGDQKPTDGAILLLKGL